MVLYPMDVAAKARVKRDLQAQRVQQSRAAGRTRSLSSEEPPPPLDANPLAGCVDVKKFTLKFWLAAICCLTVYACVLPFNNVASSLLMER